MTIRALLLAYCFAMVWAAEADAATLWIGVHAGLSSPIGELASAVGDGFHVGVGAASADNEGAVGVSLEYQVLREKRSAIEGLGIPLEVTEHVDILEAAPFARMMLAPKHSPVVPYLKGGFGLEYVMATGTLSTPQTTVPLEDWHGWLGLFGGFGVAVPIKRERGLSVEALFKQIKSYGSPEDIFLVSLEFWSRPAN